MKALVLAAVFAASILPAGASHDEQPMAAVDKATAVVIADAGRIGSASLTSLNGGGAAWAREPRQTDAELDTPMHPLGTGTLVIALGLAAAAVARPISRVLRRQEQSRRAAALASTLGQASRH